MGVFSGSGCLGLDSNVVEPETVWLFILVEQFELLLKGVNEYLVGCIYSADKNAYLGKVFSLLYDELVLKVDSK